MSSPDGRPGEISEANRAALGKIYAARIEHSSELARAHHALTRPDVPWDGLTADEWATAVLAALPWFLAARVAYLHGCPRCGTASSEIADLGGGYMECRDCGHGFERPQNQ